MKTHFSHTFLNAVLRLADAPQQTLSRVSSLMRSGLPPEPSPSSPPEHVLRRLESVFEALGELASAPHVAAALDLACDTLHAELPTAATAAGLYDIDSDAVHVVAARGVEHDLVRGTFMSRERCFAGGSAQQAVILSGAAGCADWLGAGEEGSTVLLCPILHDANLLGMIALAEPLCAAQFNQDDVELVSYVATQLATVIQVHRLQPSPAQ